MAWIAKKGDKIQGPYPNEVYEKMNVHPSMKYWQWSQVADKEIVVPIIPKKGKKKAVKSETTEAEKED